MAYQLFSLPKQLNISSSFTLSAGAKAYFYVTGTTTPQNTYQDSALTTPHANPVVADSAGVLPPIYLDPTLDYKLTLTTSAGTLIYTVDPVNDKLITQDLIGNALYPRTTAEISAGVTPTDKSKTPDIQVIDARRYGFSTAASAATNVTALTNALAVATAAGGGIVRMPSGNFSINSKITIPSNTTLQGSSRGFGSYSSTVLEYTGTGGIAIQIDGFYSGLESFSLWNANTGAIGIFLNATQTTIERVTVMPKNGSAGWSVAGIQIDTSATTFTHYMHRVYVWGNNRGIDVSRGNNIVLDHCFIESNNTNVLVGNTSNVVNMTICNGSVIELFGTGHGAETDTSVSVNVIACSNFVCRDSYFEVNGGGVAGCTTQRGIKLAAVDGADICANFFSTPNASNPATIAVEIASSSALAVEVGGGNLFSGFSAAGVSTSSSGSLTQVQFGLNRATDGTPVVYDNTFTPGITFGGGSTGIAYGTRIGRYQRIGDWIHFEIIIILSTKPSSTGTLRVTGLPATSNSTTGNQPAVAVMGSVLNSISGALMCLVRNNDTALQIFYLGTGTITELTDTNFNNTSELHISGKYQLP